MLGMLSSIIETLSAIRQIGLTHGRGLRWPMPEASRTSWTRFVLLLVNGIINSALKPFNTDTTSAFYFYFFPARFEEPYREVCAEALFRGGG